MPTIGADVTTYSEPEHRLKVLLCAAGLGSAQLHGVVIDHDRFTWVVLESRINESPFWIIPASE